MILSLGMAPHFYTCIKTVNKVCCIYRDIKPRNVMLDATFNAKLGDFRLARLVDHGRRSHTMELAGTLGYKTPTA